jgi:hypothetical protein
MMKEIHFAVRNSAPKKSTVEQRQSGHCDQHQLPTKGTGMKSEKLRHSVGAKLEWALSEKLSEKLLKRGSQHADVLAPFWLRFGSVARVFTR